MILDRILPTKLAATFKNPPDWLVGALGGSLTTAGVRVTPASALTLAAYFAAIRCISEDVAKVPLILYERLEPRGKERRRDHPVYPLLKEQPNANMTAMTLRETMTQHALGWGNGYAEIVRDRDLTIQSLELLTPDRVTPRINENTERVVYEVRNRHGEQRILQDFQVFHLHGLGYDGLTGYSIAHLAREAIGLGLAQEASGSTVFSNGVRAGGILEMDGVLGEVELQNFRESWTRQYAGVENANKTMLLEHGIKFKPITIPFKESQFIEGRSFSAADIARFFRVPPHIIGIMDAATFSNIEQQSIEYVTLTLMSWFVRWEQEVKRKLLTKVTDEDLFAEHLVDALLRGDIGSRFKAYATARQWGWMSANDVLEKENSNPLPGDQGDIYLSPLNMGDAEDIGEEPEPDEPAGDEDNDGDDPFSATVIHDTTVESITEAHADVFGERIERLLKIECDRVRRIMSKDDSGEKLAEFYSEHTQFMLDGLRPPSTALCGSLWAALGGGEMSNVLKSTLEAGLISIVNNHVNHARASLDESAEQFYECWQGGRAAELAQETTEFCMAAVRTWGE
ncbi:hypothetical protein LCGC14_0323610 [marine sediment metagenome]|uniref:Phage portal protein n=1 Tax=marine sediment metagenome TaxID=412755 RepID=A0A0F9U1F8_9ZZZZ